LGGNQAMTFLKAGRKVREIKKMTHGATKGGEISAAGTKGQDARSEKAMRSARSRGGEKMLWVKLMGEGGRCQREGFSSKGCPE